ncbi:hypothetical protein SAMN06295916_0556 [Polynucleobacter victoriensis]|uniref:Uncharacterized protein n=1 Tax=Polynucleobacter victoriensis TaxID=2049319 RepID=A0A212T735_9BURK|nr:hypothetical protein SAMN06295916_0556 [Polynucleobacter victoriensis]
MLEIRNFFCGWSECLACMSCSDCAMDAQADTEQQFSVCGGCDFVHSQHEFMISSPLDVLETL